MRKLVFALCILLHMCMLCMLVRTNYYSFSFDEFYSIGSINDSFDTEYSLSIYINYLVRLLGMIGGDSYYVVKLIPVVVGMASVITILYLIYYYTNKCYAMVLFTVIMSFNSYVLFNHIYIRFYVFEELIYSLLCFFMFWGSVKKKRIFFLLAIISVLINIIYTKDLLALAIARVAIFSIICYVQRSKILNWLKKYHRRLIYCILFIFLLKCVFYVEVNDIISLNNTIKRYCTEQPVLLISLLTGYTLPVIFSILYKPSKEKMNIFIIWILTIVPIVAFILLFSHAYKMRAFVVFMPVGYLFVILVIKDMENLRLKIICAVIFLLSVLGSYFPQYNSNMTYQDVKKMFLSPKIYKETYLRDYSNIYSKAIDLKKHNYLLITLFTMEQFDYFFRIADIRLAPVGDNNIYRLSGKDIEEYLETIPQEQKSMSVFIIDKMAYSFVKDNEAYFRNLKQKYHVEDVSPWFEIVYLGKSIETHMEENVNET